ncbi:MAG TPA: hypothetical protein VMS56_13195 [Thermoanaerobaculia bacterium]|nr:hypothetical protein [Thermoanaerobaculia bacterium]
MKTRLEETLGRLRSGKRELRRIRADMSLPEKVRQVVELQKVAVTTIRRRRPLRDIERVWPLRQR